MDNYITRQEYEEHNKRMDDEHKRQNHRLEDLEKTTAQNNKLLVAVEKLALNMENMQKEQRDQGKRLEALESRDGEMWRKAVGHVITGAIGIFIGCVFKQLGM